MSIVTVKKWGNSPAVRLTADIIRDAKIKVNDRVEVTVVNGEIKMRVLKTRPTLDEMVAGITPDNRHELVDWGAPVGKEIL